MRARCAILLVFAFARMASGQFNPAFLQNSSYWTPNKSEFDTYDAEFMRDGQKHLCEMLMIFTPEFVDANTMMTLTDGKQPNSIPIIRLNQIATVPRGLVTEQRSTTAIWDARSAALLQLWFNGTDSIAKVFKMLWQQPDKKDAGWTFSATIGGKVDVQQVAASGDNALFYDELPLRVRLLDFSKAQGDADVQLAPTIASAAKDSGAFKPAKLSWKATDRDISVDLTHEGGKDHFVLDSDFPYLLREWQTADGSRFRMKNSLRVDYRNYMKNGDRERALKDPMLRHPD